MTGTRPAFLLAFPPMLKLTPAAILGEGGLLSRLIPDYEARAPQVQMAEHIERALQERRPLLCEAGTGTGKTLAYLVPALLSGGRVVVSTGTRHLQDQLFHKDLPLLRACLPVPFTAVRLKGIANYLCQRRFEEAEQTRRQRSLPLLEDDPDLFPFPRAAERRPAHERGHAARTFATISAWRERTETGDRAELSGLGDDSADWLEVSATSETRLGGRCAYFERCFVTRARRAALKAELIVVNHHLLCADLAVRAIFPDARLLPPYDALICDEAHSLEDVATEYFGVTVSTPRIHALLRDLRRAIAEGELGREAEGPAMHIERQVERLFTAIRRRALSGQKSDATRIGLLGEHLEGDPAQAALSLDTDLELAQRMLSESDAETAAQLLRRAQALRDDLALIMDGAQRPGGKYVFWLESRDSGIPGRGAIFLRASPIDIAGTLRERLYADCPAVIMTSATLAPGGDFEFARTRLGLPEAEALRLPSPFDYQRQAMLYLPDDLPEPAHPGFLRAALSRIAELIALTEGRAFLLFTSHQRMRQAHQALAPFLQKRHLVLIQGEAPKHLLVERFAAAGAENGAVLFATASFWEGVDVIGDALRLVVIDKLPFLPPDDPLLIARAKRLEEDGLDPFACYQVPRAAVALAQGFGRLIRHRGDRGIVALLDRRAGRRGYGERVLSGLPPTCPRLTDFADVARLWRRLCPTPAGADSLPQTG